MASLLLKNITRTYPNGFVAVKDSSLDTADKELIIFAGLSGCGRSTVLRMTMGLGDIFSGELYIDDKPMNDVEPKDRNTAMVFQSYALYPHMSIYDNTAFGLKLRKTPKDEIDKLVQEAAGTLDLTHLLDRKPKALSGGQRQRAAIGYAITHNPKMPLMDEPLSSLDTKLRGQTRIKISKLHRRLETTIIYATHDQAEAMTLGIRIVVMKGGIVQQVDSPQNLYDKPCNKFVAGLIGAPQINLVDATVGKDDSDVILAFGGHTIAVPTERGKKLKDGGYIDKVITLGICSEDLHDEEAFLTSSPKSVIDATIRIHEFLGAKVYLYFDMDETNFTARVNLRTTARAGDTVKLGLDLGKVHVFDKETERVVLG